MANMQEREILTAIYSDLERATDYANTALREKRKKSLDRHLVRPRGDELPGRSKLLDTSIADTTESIMAILSESWDTENICDFPPMSEGDEDQADAEARALNTLFWQDNSGYLELMSAAKNALQFGSGIVKVWRDDTPYIEVRTFTDRAALAAIPEEVLIDVEEDGDLIRATFELPRQRLRFKAIEPAYWYTDPNADASDIQECAFIAERVFFTRAELADMGVPNRKIAKLPESTDESVTDGVGSSNTDVTAKFIDGQSDKGNASTYDQERVECYWVHKRMARKRNLEAGNYRFLVSHRELLLDDAVTCWPYAHGAAWLVPNRLVGLSVYDKLVMTENMRTNALRQMADNMNFINSPRVAADPAEVHFEDLIASAPGRPIRKKNSMATVDVIPVMDITSNSLSFLQYTESLRSNQAGASLDMQSGDAQSVKNISGISAELQLGPAEQMAAMVGRNLAHTLLRGAFLLAHKIVREEWQGELTFYRGGEWVQTMPSEWRQRSRLSLNLAMSPGEARRKVAALDQVIQTLLMLIQSGAANITADWNGLHKAIVDKMRLQRLDDSEGYFIDPDSQRSKEAQQNAAQAQQQPDPMAVAMLALEQFKAQDDSQKWQEELKHKYYDTNLDAEVEEARIVADGITGAATANAGGATGTTGQDQR
jgi:hypothetical protein